MFACEVNELQKTAKQCLTVPSLLRLCTPFVFFAVHKTHRIFVSPFISKATRCFFSISDYLAYVCAKCNLKYLLSRITCIA